MCHVTGIKRAINVNYHSRWWIRHGSNQANTTSLVAFWAYVIICYTICIGSADSCTLKSCWSAMIILNLKGCGRNNQKSVATQARYERVYQSKNWNLLIFFHSKWRKQLTAHHFADREWQGPQLVPRQRTLWLSSIWSRQKITHTFPCNEWWLTKTNHSYVG